MYGICTILPALVGEWTVAAFAERTQPYGFLSFHFFFDQACGNLAATDTLPEENRLHSLIQKIAIQNIYQCTYKRLNHVVAYLRAVARTWVATGLSGGRGGGGTAFEVNPPQGTAMVLVVVE